MQLLCFVALYFVIWVYKMGVSRQEMHLYNLAMCRIINSLQIAMSQFVSLDSKWYRWTVEGSIVSYP